jgi:hypothetical protein
MYAELFDRFADLLAADPWATRMPAVVQAAAVPPDRPGGRWRLREDSGAFREMVELAGEPWPLFARSLGEPTPVFRRVGTGRVPAAESAPRRLRFLVQRGGHRAGGLSA